MPSTSDAAQATDQCRPRGSSNAERSAYFARREAAKVLRSVLQGDSRRRAVGSIKSLVYSPSVRNKKATFALVCQTLKYLPVIKAVLEDSQVLISKWKRKEELVYIVTYNVLFGQARCPADDVEKFVLRNKKALQAALHSLLRKKKVKSVDDLTLVHRISETEDESAGEESGTVEGIDSVDNNSIESEETDAEDGCESSDSEEEYQMEASCSGTGHSISLSSFSSHMRHKLSNEEINEVSKKRQKYNWEVPAPDLPNCKWIGTRECLKIPDENSIFESNMKPSLFNHWLSTYKESGGHTFHASKERMLFSIFNSYRDVLNCDKKPFYLKGQREDSSTMNAYIMHSLNHIFKTRDLVTKNDSKLSKNQESIEVDLLHNNEMFLDQGFARSKVLILLPLRSIAYRVVRRLIQLVPSSHKVNVEHMARFMVDFGGGANENEDPDKVLGPAQKSSKPSDFTALFNGNTDDHFMIGIKFTRKSIKLYSDFYKSDMIVASPLGLITLPSKQLGTDVMRVRPWYLDGNARFYRQSIILGHYLNPDMNALFNRNFVNYEGKVKLVCEYKGVLSKVLLQVRQVYERFPADSVESAEDARLQYFSEKVFPKIKDSTQGGVMLFTSSYFEFVRLRSFLKSQSASFCLLGEYTKQSDISRSRLWFFEGTQKIMLYTERAHFYHRYKIRGIKSLIIYSLPERKEFYPEIVNLLEGSEEMTCSVLFSRFDHFRLERIVGSASAKRMTRDLNDLPLLKSITSALGSSIWRTAVVTLTHAASAPPDGPSGSPLSYDVSVAQRSHIVQQSIGQAVGDLRLMNPSLMNPVSLVENHPSCRKNRDGEKVLPNGQTWRPQLLLICYSLKILSEASSLSKPQDNFDHRKLFGFRGVDNGDSDVDVADLSDSDQEDEEDEYDQLPPFKPLRKTQIAKLSKEQRRAYFEEYDYRVKLLQKKQWREELRRMREIKKKGKVATEDYGYMGDDADPDNGSPAAVPVPLHDMVLPPSFDNDNPAYRYRFLEPTSQLVARPVLDTHGWDHDCDSTCRRGSEPCCREQRASAGLGSKVRRLSNWANASLT
ncbi:hypothetical protein MLD38_028109 [Melastoma candidum]|uniref:Uncharacterized protein n=1 Tax=Melastoma candidum TaxID=119954 RepID=A0ACB9N4A7_9MYRT|nr:hypothetical protein MLD38_028109 [Melastoma candidum]